MSNINVKNGLDNGNGLIDLQVYSDGSVGVAPQNSDRLPVADRAPAPPGNQTASSLKLADGTVAAIGAVTEGQVLTLVDGVIVGGEGGGGSEVSADLVAATAVQAGHKGTITGQAITAATTSNISGFIAAGAGPGKTLTKSSNGTLTLDGVLLAEGDLVLIKNAASDPEDRIHRGLYVVTDAGDGSSPWVLTRSTLLDTDEKLADNIGKSVAMNDGGATQGGNWYRLSVSNLEGGIDVEDGALPTFTAFNGPVTIDGNGITAADGKTLAINSPMTVEGAPVATALAVAPIQSVSTDTAVSATIPVTRLTKGGNQAVTVPNPEENGFRKTLRSAGDGGGTFTRTITAATANHIAETDSVITSIVLTGENSSVTLIGDLVTTPGQAFWRVESVSVGTGGGGNEGSVVINYGG